MEGFRTVGHPTVEHGGTTGCNSGYGMLCMQLHCVIIHDTNFIKFLFLGPDDADAFKQGIIGYYHAGYAVRTEDALLLDAGAKDPYQQPACRVLITLS